MEEVEPIVGGRLPVSALKCAAFWSKGSIWLRAWIPKGHEFYLAAGARSGDRTRPAGGGGSCTTVGTPRSSTLPGPAACWPTSMGRTAASVAQWPAAQPDPRKTTITHVTIDLSASHAMAVTEALRAAVIVADRSHLVQLANTMLTEVRQHATREVRGRRGRKRDPEWAARLRLLLGYERLSPAAFTKLWNALIDAGEPAWRSCTSTPSHSCVACSPSPATADRERISHLLWLFYEQAAASGLTRGPPTRRDHRDLVAHDRGIHHHRILQRPSRGLQPTRQTRRPRRLRRPQPVGRPQSGPRFTRQRLAGASFGSQDAAIEWLPASPIATSWACP